MSVPTDKRQLPADYEECGTCGCDHSYDYPLMTVEEQQRALLAHLDDHPIPPYDLLVTGYSKR